MKKILLILFIISPFHSYSQIKLDTLNKEVSFEKIYEVAKTKVQIHQLAHEWIAINFKDANEVIKLNTDDKIICKGLFDVEYIANGYSSTYNVYFILETDFKEGKYRLNMNSFEMDIMDTKIPVGTYFSNYSFKNYVENIKKEREKAKDKYSKKVYNKMLENEKEMFNTYNESRTAVLLIRKSITKEINSIAQNLFNYISKKSDDKW